MVLSLSGSAILAAIILSLASVLTLVVDSKLSALLDYSLRDRQTDPDDLMVCLKYRSIVLKLCRAR